MIPSPARTGSLTPDAVGEPSGHGREDGLSDGSWRQHESCRSQREAVHLDEEQRYENER